jgi:hypothetical protein
MQAVEHAATFCIPMCDRSRIAVANPAAGVGEREILDALLRWHDCHATINRALDQFTA